MIDLKEKYMKIALEEARKSFEEDEVPVGAVIVKDDKVIAKAHNLKEKKKSPIAHAEILAIEKACKKLENWRLDGCEIFVTLEPCEMCKSAIEQARISKVYIGTLDDKTKMANPDVSIEDGILREECSELLKKFFKRKR